jgi:hypothetical protein
VHVDQLGRQWFATDNKEEPFWHFNTDAVEILDELPEPEIVYRS